MTSQTPATPDNLEEAIADPLVWAQRFTTTKDFHWLESGASSPYRPLPDKPYLRPLLNLLQTEPILFIKKSRDMMVSWMCMIYFTHVAMTIPGREILAQSQKEDKAWELVEYSKILYGQQHQALKERYPLTKPLIRQPAGALEFANGSRIIGIPEGADQVRSYHPWALYMDEACFQPKAGESYDHAIAACQKIVLSSSAAPGWFADVVCENL